MRELARIVVIIVLGVAFILGPPAVLQMLDEAIAITTWLGARWKKWRGKHGSRLFENYVEARARRRRLADAETFELWRPRDRSADWRLSPQVQVWLIQAREVAAGISVLLHDARSLAFAKMEKLRGAPINEARDAWRMLLGEIVDAEGAFESLLTSPGQGLHAAEGLSLLPSAAKTRYPLDDVLDMLIVERRYQTFLSLMRGIRERLRAGMPPAPNLDSATARAMYEDWQRLERMWEDAMSEDVRARMTPGRVYLHYAGLLTFKPSHDSLRDEMHESLNQARAQREGER